MIDNIFIKNPNEYIRDIDPLKDYFIQMSNFISVSMSMPLEEAKKKVKEIIKKRLVNPTVKHFFRGDNGDRIVENTPLLNYINSNIKEGDILTPTFTTYMHPRKKRSMLSEFTETNVKIRNVSKAEARKAKAKEQLDLYEHFNSEQNNKKTWNNSMSGAFGQEGSILYNPTAHSSLTSMTRTVASLANSNNEKMLAGNRHYLTQIDTLNNCIYIATKCNVEKINHVLRKFNLHVPTVEDTLTVIRRSADIYWLDEKFTIKYLRPYLNTLQPEQLAAICYTSDLYQVKSFNDDFTRRLLERLSSRVSSDNKDPSVVSDVYKIDGDIRNFAHAIWFHEVKGFGTDYELMHEKGIAASILATCLNIAETLQHYKDFVQAFLVSDIMPHVTNKIRNMARRTVVISDTDSTCFSLDHWVIWYAGEFSITPKNIAVASAVAYMTTQMIAHLLAMFSANMNVEKKSLFVLSMKNEFLWTVHLPTEVSKHYAALTVMKEGSVYKTMELELKGVHLKNSATPVNLTKDASDLLMSILTSVHNNEKVKLMDIIDRMVTIENVIEESIIVKNETVYFKKSKIKDKTAYSLDETKSPYQKHTLWRMVFEPKYGEIPAPPYDVIKIPTTVDRRRKLSEWLGGLDTDIASRLTTWATDFGKENIPTVYLSEDYVKSNGIPSEIVKIIDIKRIILDLTMQHRMILMSLGVMLDSERLIREHFI